VEGDHLWVGSGSPHHLFDQVQWYRFLVFYSGVVVLVASVEVLKKLANCSVGVLPWVWSAGCQEGLCHITDGTEASAGNKVFVAFCRFAPGTFTDGLGKGSEESVALFDVALEEVGIIQDPDLE
jgi:hypothetical protein